jgi:VanZ family protein
MQKSKQIQRNAKVKRTTFVVAWVAVFLWMVLIFAFSAQPAEVSGELSKGVTEAVVRAVAAVFDVEIDVSTGSTFAMYHYLARKFAHGALYFILALLVINALKKSGYWGLKAYGLAFGICVVYAASDEVHQLFVPGRGGQVGDVLIDSAGTLLGLGIYSIVTALLTYFYKRGLRGKARSAM